MLSRQLKARAKMKKWGSHRDMHRHGACNYVGCRLKPQVKKQATPPKRAAKTGAQKVGMVVAKMRAAAAKYKKKTAVAEKALNAAKTAAAAAAANATAFM